MTVGRPGKRRNRLGETDAPRTDGQLEGSQQLEQSQPQQGGPHGQRGPPLPPAGELFPPSLPGQGEEEQVHAPHGEGVPHPDGGALGDLDAVDLGAALRAQVRDPPGTGLVPEKGGVLAGDGGKIEADICGGGAAQDIFPVVDGEGAAAGQAELSPLLRGVGDSQQAADGPHQHQQGEDGEEEADQGGVPPDGLGVLCQPGAQELGKAWKAEIDSDKGTPPFGDGRPAGDCKTRDR